MPRETDMRHNPHHFVDDPEAVRRLLRERPVGHSWSAPTTISLSPPIARCWSTRTATNSPCSPHVGRPDEKLQPLWEAGGTMLVVQGVHRYISPSCVLRPGRRGRRPEASRPPTATGSPTPRRRGQPARPGAAGRAFRAPRRAPDAAGPRVGRRTRERDRRHPAAVHPLPCARSR